MIRHWYTCVGDQFARPTDEERLAGVQVGSNVCCTRQMTFQELCCMDFTKLTDYVQEGNSPPFAHANCGMLNVAAAQMPPGDAGAIADNAAAVPGAPVAMVCTTQMASAEIAARGSGGAVSLDAQDCIPVEFAVADLTGTEGQLLLDKRIDYLQAQGLPGNAIPTCNAQVASCPPTSGRGLHCASTTPPTAPCPPNSASAAKLASIGQPMSLAEEARIEDEEAAAPVNQVGADDHPETRSYMATLGQLALMSEEDVRNELGTEMRFTLLRNPHGGESRKVLRMHVEAVTVGDHFVLSGRTKEPGPTRVEVVKGKAELITGSTREALSTSDMVLSTAGRRAGKRRGASLTTMGSFTMESTNAGGNQF